MLSKLLLTALPFLSLSAAATTGKCREVTFLVNGTAENKNLTGVPLGGDLTALLTFVNSAPSIVVSGPQNISGTYCTPLKTNGNSNKLQVLFHSITGTRAGFQALGGIGTDFAAYNPDKYSYVEFANALGYPVLNIDRLGNGRSSHPDPVLVVQAPYEMALYNDLALQIRAGSKQLGKAYNFLIYFGNSYGSQLGAGIAGEYHSAYDEYILTGFTNSVDKGLAGVLLVDATPAAVVDPARFGNLPPGYLTSASEVGRTNSFFGSKAQVSFEDTVAHLFFTRKDVVSVGQFVSVYALPFVGAGFTGRVLVLDGEEDQPFCGPGSPVLGPAHCGQQLNQTHVLFPDAKYNWKTVDKIGHAVQLHNRTPLFYATASAFLAGANFAGGAPL